LDIADESEAIRVSRVADRNAVSNQFHGVNAMSESTDSGGDFP